MECKKCGKEYLDSELNDGVCADCKRKKKGNIITKNFSVICISVVVSVVIMIAIEIWANNDVRLSDFKMESFNLEIEDSSYTGKGIISCKNKNTDYIVLLQSINKTNNEIDYHEALVHNGVGEINTFDSKYTGMKEKPEYEFKIIGYRSFKKI